MSQIEMGYKEAFKFIRTQLLVMAVIVLPTREVLFAASAPVCQRAPAAINRAAIAIVKPSKIFYGEDGMAISPEMIANFNVIKHEEKPYDMAALIPLDMKPTDNSSEVFSQVADKSMTTILNSEAVRGTSLGRAATEVEQKLKTEVTIGGNEPKSIQHKFNFSAQAFQATAQVLYTGLTNAALKYKVAEQKLGVEVFEKVTGDKDLVMSHTMTPDDRLSEVSLRWNF